jgi:hypothetical protein
MTLMTPQSPAPVVAAAAQPPAAGAGLDAADLAQILADTNDIEAHRLSIVGHHTMDVGGPVMLALSRIAGLREQIEVEVRLVRRYLAGGS